MNVEGTTPTLTHTHIFRSMSMNIQVICRWNSPKHYNGWFKHVTPPPPFWGLAICWYFWFVTPHGVRICRRVNFLCMWRFGVTLYPLSKPMLRDWTSIITGIPLIKIMSRTTARIGQILVGFRCWWIWDRFWARQNNNGIFLWWQMKTFGFFKGICTGNWNRSVFIVCTSWEFFKRWQADIRRRVW